MCTVEQINLRRFPLLVGYYYENIQGVSIGHIKHTSHASLVAHQKLSRYYYTNIYYYPYEKIISNTMIPKNITLAAISQVDIILNINYARWYLVYLVNSITGTAWWYSGLVQTCLNQNLSSPMLLFILKNFQISLK